MIVTAVVALLPGTAGAVIGGHPDGMTHPYVGYESNGVFACSGTLLSPTVMLTAAHCFSDSTSIYGTNPVTGAPPGAGLVRPPNLINTPRDQRVWYFGSYYFDPDFTIGAAGGLPGFDTHDVAVIIFTPDRLRGPVERDRNRLLRPDSWLGHQQSVWSAAERGSCRHVGEQHPDRHCRLWRSKHRPGRRTMWWALQAEAWRLGDTLRRPDDADREQQRHQRRVSEAALEQLRNVLR